ncbi:hypothetical protein [Metaclostridioides mangenotii]|uniref:hypothetical protein n=1 Tax=Metaclostridioides mangenotii TaxID=1540 RepID=UPI0004650F08|nr:hypothetical protein [Clostridioides mangenotii]
MDKLDRVDRDTRFLGYDASKLSDDEKRFLETYHLMVEEQEEFLKNIAPISYICVLDDKDIEDYSNWQ